MLAAGPSGRANGVDTRTPGGVSFVSVLKMAYCRVDRPELAILDRDLWDSVQSRLVQHTRERKTASEAGRVPRKPTAYLLSSLLRCGCAGYRIVGAWRADAVVQCEPFEALSIRLADLWSA